MAEMTPTAHLKKQQGNELRTWRVERRGWCWEDFSEGRGRSTENANRGGGLHMTRTCRGTLLWRETNKVQPDPERFSCA